MIESHWTNDRSKGALPKATSTQLGTREHRTGAMWMNNYHNRDCYQHPLIRIPLTHVKGF
jgi:hypothetical protein